MMFLQHFVLFYALFGLIQCFPSGAPADACDTLMPRHSGTYASFDHSPYFVLASSNIYGVEKDYDHSSSPIKIDIGGAPFKGFIVTALDSSTGQRIGSFAQVKGTTILPCSAITHADSKPKKFASFLWNPPKDKQGQVTFIATIVHSFKKYYPGLVAQVHQDHIPIDHNALEWFAASKHHYLHHIPNYQF